MEQVLASRIKADAPRHGGSGSSYSHQGCRCEECTAANTARYARRHKERMASRVVIDGRLVAPGDRQHGNESTYTNWGCRCEPCCQVHSEYMANYKARK